MRITINHLTKMSHPYIGVAGVDASGVHRRPVLATTNGENVPLGRSLLCSRRGPFQLGAVVDLGDVRSWRKPPEVENVRFDLERAGLVDVLDPREFWIRLEKSAGSSLRSIFGSTLEATPTKTGVFLTKGKGVASLGVLKLRKAQLSIKCQWKNKLRERREPVLRCWFEDPDMGHLGLKVNDLRLWESDHDTPATDAVNRIKSGLDNCFVSFGLGRLWPPQGVVSLWWLRVNNIFPRGDPLWARE